MSNSESMKNSEIIQRVVGMKSARKRTYITIYASSNWWAYINIDNSGNITFSVDNVQGIGVCNSPVVIQPNGTCVANYKLTKAVSNKIESTYRALVKANIL